MLQLTPIGRRRAKPGDIGIPGVKQDHPTRAQIGVKAAVSLRARKRLVRADGPVEERKEGDFIVFEIDANWFRWFDRGTPPQDITQPLHPGARGVVQPGVTGQNMGQHNLSGGRQGEVIISRLRLHFAHYTQR